MAQSATASSEEQGTGGDTLHASRDSKEEGQNTASEVADKNIQPRRDWAMAPPDLEVSNESNTPLDPQTTQDSPDTGHAEDDGAEVVQQVRVDDPSPGKDNFESEQSREAAIGLPRDVEIAMDNLKAAFVDEGVNLNNAIERSLNALKKTNSAEAWREMDGLMEKVQAGRAVRIWNILRIRRIVLDVITARAIASFMLEDYREMESHVLNAIEKARPLSATNLYKSLQRRCQYIIGVALYYQQRFKDAADAFEKSENCPAAPGISLRDAEEWSNVIKAALQAPQESRFPDQREDIPGSEITPTQERRTSVALFQSRKLSNINEGIEAGESANHSTARTAERPFEEALPSPANTPLTPSWDPRSSWSNVFQRKQSLKRPGSTRPNLLRNESIRSQFASAFASNRSRATSITSMNEDEIMAAFGGGGGAYQSRKNTRGGFETPRESWASGYEREEFTIGDDDFREQRWAAWERMIEREDELFKMDEMNFVAEERKKIEEHRKKIDEQHRKELRKWEKGEEDETPAEEQKEEPEVKKSDFEVKREKRLRLMEERKLRLKIEQSAGRGAGGVR